MWVRLLLGAAALAAAIFVVLGMASGDGGPDGPRVGYPAVLETTEDEIVDENGNPVLLRGFNVIEHPGPDGYRQIADAGFNAIRLVLFWDDMEPERGQVDQEELEAVDETIAHAREAGLYVILDLIHIYDGDSRTPEWARTGDVLRDVAENADHYLTTMAERYRDEPAVAMYDPVNEAPTFPVDQDAVLEMYDEVIETIRSVDEDKIIAIEPSFGDSSMEDADFDILSDRSNLVLAAHDYYAGGAGDGYDETGMQDGEYAWDGETGYDGQPAELEAHLESLLADAERAGIPLWIGEFGMAVDAPGFERFVEEKLALYEHHGLGYAWWLYGGGSPFSATGEDGEVLPFVERLLAEELS